MCVDLRLQKKCDLCEDAERLVSPSVSKTDKNVDRVKGSLYSALGDYRGRNNKH
jgi:hypothetical protein